ncbi:hypothetical protein [Comamonas sp.]|uniref:hypothetical protein n=1 Tax=Comamonas sp. TaxID=34028 RepID=UPI003D145B03
MNWPAQSHYLRDRLPGFRLHVAAASAFCRARSALMASRSLRAALSVAILTMPAMHANAMTAPITNTGVDTSIGPMEWLVLSLWVFALCFLANIVFHWIYVPLIGWISGRLSKGDQQ